MSPTSELAGGGEAQPRAARALESRLEVGMGMDSGLGEGVKAGQAKTWAVGEDGTRMAGGEWGGLAWRAVLVRGELVLLEDLLLEALVGERGCFCAGLVLGTLLDLFSSAARGTAGSDSQASQTGTSSRPTSSSW